METFKAKIKLDAATSSGTFKFTENLCGFIVEEVYAKVRNGRVGIRKEPSMNTIGELKEALKDCFKNIEIIE